MNREHSDPGLAELGVASRDTRGAWFVDEDTEAGRMPHAGLTGD